MGFENYPKKEINNTQHNIELEQNGDAVDKEYSKEQYNDLLKQYETASLYYTDISINLHNLHWYDYDDHGMPSSQMYKHYAERKNMLQTRKKELGEKLKLLSDRLKEMFALARSEAEKEDKRLDEINNLLYGKMGEIVDKEELEKLKKLLG